MAWWTREENGNGNKVVALERLHDRKRKIETNNNILRVT